MTYVLVPGAGGEAWYWHLVVERLPGAIAVELPAADPDAGLWDYAKAIEAAAASAERVTLVAQSMGAFCAPLARLDVERIVLVAPMIPAPGESASRWWTSSGLPDAAAPPFDPIESFFHDVPEDVRAEAFRRGEPGQADKPFEEPWPLDAWPDLPTRVIAGARDRLFPLPFMRRLARERVGAASVDVIDSGHLPALARPDELVSLLR